MYDEDYQAYSRAHFDTEQRMHRPWTLEPPEQILEHTKLTGMFDLAFFVAIYSADVVLGTLKLTVISTGPIVQHMYDYAHYRLKMRRVSPRTSPFLQRYRDTARLLLDNSPDSTVTEILKIKLAAFNELLHRRTILMKEPSIQEQEGYKALKDIVIYRYLAEYEDYLGDHCKELKTAAMVKKDRLKNIKGGFSNGQTWQMLQDKMNAEKSAYDEWLERMHDNAPPATALILIEKAMMNRRAPPMKTVLTIENAISGTGMGYDNTLYSIRSYVARNEAMHSMISLYIQNCDWNALALQLSRDIKDLPHVFGGEEYKHMLRVLHSVRDRYFIGIENPEEPALTALAIRSWVRRQADINRKRIDRQKDEKEQVEA